MDLLGQFGELSDPVEVSTVEGDALYATLYRLFHDVRDVRWNHDRQVVEIQVA